jgi:glutathione synthase/RimK-type ligase-like ATP-grasp enzyme
MFHLWTASYKWPTVPVKESFIHSEIGKSCQAKDICHTAIDLFKLQILPSLKYQGETIKRPDIIIFSAMMISRKIYEQMKELELSGCKFLNNVDAHYEAGDKILVFKKLKLANIPIPKTIFLKIPFEDINIDMIDSEIGWPCVVKWKHGFANLGVSICHNVFEIYSIVKTRKHIAAEHKLPENYFDELIVQKMLRTDHLIHVHSIGKTHHAVLQFHPTNNGFKSNLQKEGVINLPYKMDNKMIHMIEMMMDCLKLDTVRTDLMFDGDSYKICEVNPQASHGQVTMVHLKNISDIVVNYAITKTTIAH